MTRYEAEEKAREAYAGCYLHYNVSEDSYYKDTNQKNYQKMKKALNDVGILLHVENGTLHLSISPEKYIRKRDRHSGKQKKIAWNREDQTVFKYSDIVFFTQSMKDPEVAAKIGMPIATYYRHKKVLKESEYYKSLDRNRLSDKEYLESVNENYHF